MSVNDKIDASGFWDKTGAAVSWLCAAHCLLLPAAVAALPAVGLGLLLDERVELAFIALSVLIAAVSLLPAYWKRHRRHSIPLLFAAGLALMTGAHLWLEDALVGKSVALVAGAALISTAHLANLRN